MGATIARGVGLTLLASVALMLVACGAHDTAALKAVTARVVPSNSTVATASTQQAGSEATDSADDSSSDSSDAEVAARPKGRPVATGDPARSAILDGLRPTVESDLGQRVRFEVETLEVSGDWAGFQGRPVMPDGGRIDYRKTRYSSWIEQGVFDEGIVALLRKRDGRWHVIEYACGHTDAPGSAWLYEHKVPANLFAN